MAKASQISMAALSVFDGYGNDTGGNDVTTALPAPSQDGKLEQNRARAPRPISEFGGSLRSLSRAAPRADDQAQQIESSAIEMVTAEIDDRSIDQCTIPRRGGLLVGLHTSGRAPPELLAMLPPIVQAS